MKRFWLTANEVWYVIESVFSICWEEEKKKLGVKLSSLYF